MKKLLSVLLLLLLTGMIYLTFKENSNLPSNNGIVFYKLNIVKSEKVIPNCSFSQVEQDYEEEFNINSHDSSFRYTSSISDQQEFKNSAFQQEVVSTNYNKNNTKVENNSSSAPILFSKSRNAKQYGFASIEKLPNASSISSDLDSDESSRENCHPIKPPKPPKVPIGDGTTILLLCLVIYSIIIKVKKI